MELFLVGVAILLVVVFLVARRVFPLILTRPALTGQHLVGYLETSLTDQTRIMLGAQARVVALDVWYPASAVGSSLEPFDTPLLRTMLQKVQGIPSFGKDVASSSWRDVPALVMLSTEFRMAGVDISLCGTFDVPRRWGISARASRRTSF